MIHRNKDGGLEMEVRILGIIIGTASGWDQVGDFAVCFYDFKPSHILVPSDECLSVDLDSGDFQITNDEGEVLYQSEAFIELNNHVERVNA